MISLDAEVSICKGSRCLDCSPPEREKCLLDTLVRLGTRLEKPEPELVGQRTALVERDGPLLVPVAFVPDEDLVDAGRGVLLNVGVPGPDV